MSKLIEYKCFNKCKYKKKMREVGDIYTAPEGDEVCEHFKRTDGKPMPWLEKKGEKIKVVEDGKTDEPKVEESGQDDEIEDDKKACLLKELEELTGKKSNPNCLIPTLEEKIKAAQAAAKTGTEGVE